MRRATLWILVALLLAGAVLLAQGPAGAQSPQQTYTMSWWTVDGGGTMSAAGAGYTLGGTAGQPDPGVLTGGPYTLGGGFWRGGVPSAGPQHTIYLPVVFR
jgi:hypothetical protein